MGDVSGDSDDAQDRWEASEKAKTDAQQTKLIAGCTPKLLAIGLIVLALGAAGSYKLLDLTKDDAKGTASSSCSSSKARKDRVGLIACTRPEDSESSSDTASSSDAAAASNASGAALGSNPGQNASGGTAPAPNPATLPPGAILFKGTSGDQIGCIRCDGMTRFLSITGPGVVASDASGRSIEAFTWEKNGKVVSFGANLNTGSNDGRYGFAVFRTIPASPPTTSPSGEADSPYRAGCAIEVHNTACRSDREGAPLFAGDKIAISVGEAGTGGGEYTCDWWFVFQPDA